MSPSIQPRVLQRGRVAGFEEEAYNPVPYDRLLESGAGLLIEDGTHLSIEHA